MPRAGHLPRRQTAAQAEYYAAEASKIETLKNALFAALETSPAGAIPTQLIDLAHTYSSLLKIQLTIMPDPAPPSASEPRQVNTAEIPAAYDPALVK
jgi:hypothetical protein